MKKIVFIFLTILCINNLAWSQEELKFFKSDNSFYLDYKRLSDDEIKKTLSSNSLALSRWERGNFSKQCHKGMKVATGVLVGVGGVITIVSFTVAVAEAAATVALFPLMSATGTQPSHSYTGTWLTIGIVLLSSGIITGILIPITKAKYKFYYSDSVDIYNKGLSKTAVNLHIGTIGNGIGFSLEF